MIFEAVDNLPTVLIWADPFLSDSFWVFFCSLSPKFCLASLASLLSHLCMLIICLFKSTISLLQTGHVTFLNFVVVFVSCILLVGCGCGSG